MGDSSVLRDLATCPAVTCPTTASVPEAARVMAEADVGLLVVVAAGGPGARCPPAVDMPLASG
jgi:CBS domain-containing protein